MQQLSPSWIWNSEAGPLREQYVRFRGRFSLDSLPGEATIQISADSRYRLFINGVAIAFGPSRCYAHHQCVDVHDIAEHLRAGENLIAVLVYQPGYSHYSYIHSGKAGMWLSLEADGEQRLVTDAKWRTSRDRSFSADVRPISIYGGGQERRDLRLAEPWVELSFSGDDWEAATVCAPSEECPWDQLQFAPLPSLVETIVEPVKTSIALAQCQSDNDPHLELRSIFASSGTAKPCHGVVHLPAIDDETLLVCYDFGSSRAGSAIFCIEGATGGEKILVGYVEKEVEGRPVLSDPETYCQVRMTDATILAPGDNHFEPFSPRGGRYLLIGVVGPCKAGLSLDVSFRSRGYPLKLTRGVVPADETLNSIAELCWRTIQACALDGMVDCPWREQAVWVGDSAISASIVAQLSGDTRLLRRMLELASQGVSPEGLLPGVIVCDSPSTAIPAYSFAWVEGLSSYLAATEDVPFVQQQWSVLSNMLAHFQRDLDQTGLLQFQPEQRQFLDWAELPPPEPSCLYSLRYLLALQLAVKIASEVGEDPCSRQWADWASTLAESIRREFFRDEIWCDDLQATSRSQHIAAFLTLTELVTDDQSQQLLEEATCCSLDQESNDLVLMSPYMHYYLFCALEKVGSTQAILDIIKHRWGNWINQGARNTWENWNVDFPDGSQCHAWSAHPLLFLSRYAPLIATNSDQAVSASLR